jgi:hypothetical protein
VSLYTQQTPNLCFTIPQRTNKDRIHSSRRQRCGCPTAILAVRRPKTHATMSSSEF